MITLLLFILSALFNVVKFILTLAVKILLLPFKLIRWLLRKKQAKYLLSKVKRK